MNTLPLAGALRAMSVALLLAAPAHAAETDALPPGALPPLYDAGAIARDTDEGERESPPQRATREQLEALAAGAVAPKVVGLKTNGLGAGGLDWTFLGPRPMANEYWSSGRAVGGRVSCVAPHPTDPNTAYAAAAQGGVWKTTDGGATWNVLTETLPSISSGWVAIDPIDPNTLWYGTGEAHYSLDSFYGAGLFKSADAGATWAQVATPAQVGSYISRVVIKPGSSDTIFVGGSRGFVRSTNGGATWTTPLTGAWCDDIVVNPTNGTVCASFNGTGVFRSTDAGATWALALALPARSNLGISPSNPSVVYVGASANTGTILGVWRSSDGGGTWALMPPTPDYLAGQGWYDNTVVVSPTDSALVFVGGVYPYDTSRHGVMRSSNAGASWTDVTIGADAKAVHPDQHCLAFGPTGTLWLANDGGVFKSADLGAHWTDCNATLAVAQFYTVATHPTNPSDIIGGTQDNGSVRFTGADAWPVLISGDGGPVMYQRESPNYFFTSYVRLNPIYKFNNGAYVSSTSGSWATSGVDRVDWANGPLLEDPVANATYYAGTQRVWKSQLSGTLWSPLSGDLTAGSGTLRSVVISPANANLFWTGASDGSMRRSRDAGATWTYCPGLGGAVPTIVPSPSDTALAYACVDISSGSRVMRSADGGSTWASVTGNLPGGVRAMSLAVDWRPAPPRLYVGTDFGVYASLDGGANWVRTGANMPNVAVYSLALDLANSKLVAATHGRGMWRADLDVTGPALALTAPAGGESWPVTTTRTITWTATDPSGVASVDLALSTDGGATYPRVIATGLPNTGSYAWSVGPANSATARVRVIARDGLGQPTTTASGSNFSIVSTTAAEGVTAAFALDPVLPALGAGPFRVDFGLPAATAASVDVFDAGGRRVRSLAEGPFGPGRHSLAWDGRDASGAPAAPGVYFVRLRAGQHDATRRIAVIR